MKGYLVLMAAIGMLCVLLELMEYVFICQSASDRVTEDSSIRTRSYSSRIEHQIASHMTLCSC